MEGFFLALIPLTYSLMRDTFPQKMLAFSVTIAASGVGIVTISGPFLAGYLVDNHGWQSVFWFLFALQLVGGLLVLAIVPESRVRNRVRIDWLGATLIGGGVGLLLLGLSMGSAWQWGDTRTLACLSAASRCSSPGRRCESRVKEPLMDLTLLRSRSDHHDHDHQHVRRRRARRRGHPAADDGPDAARPRRRLRLRPDRRQLVRFTVPAGVLTVLFGFGLGAVIRRIGPRIPLVVGAVLSVIGGLGLAFAHPPRTGVLISFALFGIAQALVFSSLPNLVIASVPVEQQAISAGMTNTMQALGTAAGIQILFVILTGHVAQLVQGTPIFSDTRLHHRVRIAAGFALVAVVAAFAVPTRRSTTAA